MSISPDEKIRIELQIKRMIRRGQVFPKKFSVFTDEKIIQMYIHAKLIQNEREKKT